MNKQHFVDGRHKIQENASSDEETTRWEGGRFDWRLLINR